jgi:hypothetical protein
MASPVVFLSSASIDLKEWREVLHGAFFRVLTQDRCLGSSLGDVRRLLAETIAESDCIIHLADMGYGSNATDLIVLGPRDCLMIGSCAKQNDGKEGLCLLRPHDRRELTWKFGLIEPVPRKAKRSRCRATDVKRLLASWYRKAINPAAMTPTQKHPLDGANFCQLDRCFLLFTDRERRIQ